MNSTVSSGQARITLIEGCLNLYQRKMGANFTYEVFVDGKRVDRKSTGTHDLKSASDVARQRYGEVLARQSQGLHSTSVSIKKIIKGYIEERRQDMESGRLNPDNFYQTEKVLNDYFMPWVEENNYKSLTEIKSEQLHGKSNPDSYYEYRLAIPKRRTLEAEENAKIEYMRGGTVVKSPISAQFLKVPSEATLKKQIHPIRGLYNYAFEKSIISEIHIPRFYQKKNKASRIDEYNEYDAYAASNETMFSNPDNWLTPDDYKHLVKIAHNRYRASLSESSKTISAKITAAIKSGKLEGFIAESKQKKSTGKMIYTDTVKGQHYEKWISTLSWRRLMLTSYVMLMVNTGLRPQGMRQLKWKHIREIKLPNGRLALNVLVYEKGNSRSIVCQHSLIHRVKELAWYTQSCSFEDIIDDPVLRDQLVIPVKNFKTQLKALFNDAGFGGRGYTTYTFRHTYINFQLLEGASVEDVAINCGNSIEVIQKHYSHIKPLILAEQNRDVRRNGVWE